MIFWGIVLFVGYVLISRLVGMVFRVALSVVFVIVFAGGIGLSSLFDGVASNVGQYVHSEADRPARGVDRNSRPEAKSLGDMTVSELGTAALLATKAMLNGTIEIVDGLTGNRTVSVTPSRPAVKSRNEPQPWPYD